jgi:hypothetical protein
MKTSVSQAIFIRFDDIAESALIGAATVSDDHILAVAGLVGFIPRDAAQKMYFAARDGGAKVTEIEGNEDGAVICLSWGDFDFGSHWDVIHNGIATSMTKAFLNAAKEAGLIDSSFDVSIVDSFGH